MEIAATFGFAAGLAVGYLISRIRETNTDVKLAREYWRGKGDELRKIHKDAARWRSQPSILTRHETRR